jgi:hypothetical protein
MWLTGAETCRRVIFFVTIQFKCLSVVSAYCWICLSKFIIVIRDRGTGPHFEPDECSVCPSPLPHLSRTSCFFIIHFNTLLSPIRRHKLRVVVQFSKAFLLFRPSICVLNIVGTSLLKYIVCILVFRVET